MILNVMELDTKKIEKIRKYKGYTQIAFSEKIGITGSAYKKLIKNRNFRTEQVIRISDLLGISIQNLFTSDPNKEYDETMVEEDKAEYKIKNTELKQAIKDLKDRIKDKEEIIKFLKESNK